MRAAAGRVAITTTEIRANDELCAKILLLSEGDLLAAVISLDYISLGGDIGTVSDGFYPALKERLAALGIGTLLCGVTHTHTPEPMVVPEEELLLRITEKAKALLPTLGEATLSYAEAHEGSFLLNREIPTEDGRDWPVRQAHPLPREESYSSLAEPDDTVRIVRILGDDGASIATLFTFGCHPLVGYANDRATAGFPGVAERLIESAEGGVAMMLQGMAGDVCELDYKNYFKPKSCREHGLRLGAAVLSAFGDATPIGEGLACATATALFPMRSDFDEKLKAIRERQLALCGELGSCPLSFKSFLPLYTRYLLSPDYPLDDKYVYLREEALGVTQLRDQDTINRGNIEKYLENIAVMEELSRLSAEYDTLLWHKERVERMGSAVPVEVTAIRLGDRVLLSAPFEPLTEVGRILTARYGERVIPATYSNGYQHYGAGSRRYSADSYEARECDLAPEWQDAYLAAADAVLAPLGILPKEIS